MAASQARLLTITARMHDVEYKAQSIQNAKIQLSTQSDQVYQEYLEALDATTLTVDDINGNTITANFNNLVGKNGVETGNNYALRTSNGQLIVEDEVKDAYDEYDGNDPYEFAMMMIFGDAGNALDRDNLEQCENQAFENNSNIGSDDMNSMIAIKDKMDKILTDNGVEDYNDLTDEAKDEYDELEQSYKYKLYKNFGSEIFALAYADEGVEEGIIGWGLGKAGEVTAAIAKGVESAKKNLVKVPILKGTVPHEQSARFGGAEVFIKPASHGTGVVAGGAMRAVLESVGVTDVLAKSKGSSNPHNLVKATIEALSEMRDARMVAQNRGISVEKVFRG